MRIINAALEALASNYTRGMTSIRGRRIHRLVMREFSSFDFVVLARTNSGEGALLGLSEGRAALCATDGKGKEVTVTTWTFPALSVSETRFDLLKDSLPTLGTSPCPTSNSPISAGVSVLDDTLPPQARAMVAKAVRALK